MSSKLTVIFSMVVLLVIAAGIVYVGIVADSSPESRQEFRREHIPGP
ncbi:MAG: hypothetical protein U0990_12600 [Candidatus Nanopelagicales bacterium]|nr:hypothetical protein [Candidatus Nanopelagicales bacterium]